MHHNKERQQPPLPNLCFAQTIQPIEDFANALKSKTMPDLSAISVEQKQGYVSEVARRTLTGEAFRAGEAIYFSNCSANGPIFASFEDLSSEESQPWDLHAHIFYRIAGH